MPFKDLTGRTFDRLTVLDRVENRGPYVQWLCQCKCGKRHKATTNSLTTKNTRSCGCLALEVRSKTGKANTTHGMTDSVEFGIWRGIIRRCTEKENKGYRRYGGRGIKVCKRWLVFENFFADVGSRPSPQHSLDRYPNNNGNYEPSNVRWATRKQQMRNMRNNKVVTFNGKTQTLVEWAEELHIKYATLKNRINTLNWPIERAFTESIHPR